MTANSYSLLVCQNLSLLAISVITPGIFRPVEMHSAFETSTVVRGGACHHVPSVEDTDDLAEVAYIYSSTRDRIQHPGRLVNASRIIEPLLLEPSPHEHEVFCDDN